MIDPTKLDKLNSLMSPPIGQNQQAAGQYVFTDLVGQMMVSAGSDTMEANLLQDWSKMMGADQSTANPVQPLDHHHKKTSMNELTAYLQNPVNTANPIMTATPPGVDGAASADNSNTGSINSGLMI